MSGLLSGSVCRALRSPRCAGGVLFVTALILTTGCDVTEPADSLPDIVDLLVHTGREEHSMIHGIRLADKKALFSFPGSAAAWSPDGQLISYMEGIGYDSVSGVHYAGPLVLATASGQRLGLLSEIGGSHAWSPDGTMIAVQYWELEREAYYSHGSLHVVNVAGGATRFVEHGGGLSWSPDSRQLTGCWNTCIANADGTGVTYLEGGGHDSVWSPDGGSIAFWAPVDYDRSEIFLISPAGGERTQLTTSSTPGARDMESKFPVWAPDGMTIAFIRSITPVATFPNGYSHLYVMNRDGSNPRRLGEASEFPVAWSPDGRRIAYTPYDNHDRVWVINVDGTEEGSVAAGRWPVWRPVSD
jgi:Tol biopolymer transport system component